jgi:uncharacterized membrane protein
VPLCAAAGAFAVWIAVANSADLLLYYPVVVNAALLAVFAASLVFPPSVIERLARVTEPDLPAAVVGYTRTVTVAWCFFFR